MQLTQCQEKARLSFFEFIRSDEQEMILEGYAGTGKTTLVMRLIEEIEKSDELRRIATGRKSTTQFLLTATTNKAAEALEIATGRETRTVHSGLGIGVRTDYTTGESFSFLKKNFRNLKDEIIFIDESSYIDGKLLKLIKRRTEGCKVIYMGDPTQLTPVESTNTPAFDQDIRRVKLEQVVRQAADNPIQAYTKGLREHILGGPFPLCKPDGEAIIYLSREDFDNKVLEEFTRDGWKASDSRVLAWRNATVIKYNTGIHSLMKGRAEFAVGDHVINNHFVSNGNQPIKTDATVTITFIGEPSTLHGFPGRYVNVTKSEGLFLPDDPKDIDRAVAKAVLEENPSRVKEIQSTWVDFRAAYACTINKSQGSTYDKAFVDLDDIGKCHDSNQLARMLYVGISRARTSVYMTGDLV